MARGRSRRRTRRGSGLAAVVALVMGAVLTGPAAGAEARETAPGSPGAPQAPAVVFAEDFEYQQDATPQLIDPYRSTHLGNVWRHHDRPRPT